MKEFAADQELKHDRTARAQCDGGTHWHIDGTRKSVGLVWTA